MAIRRLLTTDLTSRTWVRASEPNSHVYVSLSMVGGFSAVSSLYICAGFPVLLRLIGPIKLEEETADSNDNRQ